MKWSAGLRTMADNPEWALALTPASQPQRAREVSRYAPPRLIIIIIIIIMIVTAANELAETCQEMVCPACRYGPIVHLPILENCGEPIIVVSYFVKSI